MRHLLLCLVTPVFGACATAVIADEAPHRGTCLPASVVEVVRRVDGGRMLVEEVVTQQVCQGAAPRPPPVLLAEVRLRPDLPACPIGALGAALWPGGHLELEPAVASVLAARPPAERARFELALRSFSSNARAFVIGCAGGGTLEWLFVKAPGMAPPRVGFFDGDTVRFAPGHENVLFPTPALTAAAPALPPAGDEPVTDEPEGAEAPEPIPPRVTATGCPAERLSAQWVVRRFGSGAHPPGEVSMPGPETLERWSLRLEGGTATLVAEEDTRPKPRPGAGEWTCRRATTVQGTVERRGAALTLRFGSLVARCQDTTLEVQPAQARRHPTRLPQRLDEEGCARYRWATSRPLKTRALVCTGELPLDALLVMGAPPGLERLVLENDCQEPTQREALRLVPADGGVAPAM